MALEQSHDRGPHHKVSRRGFLHTGIQLTVGFSIMGCVGSDVVTPSVAPPQKRTRTKPREPHPDHFDNRTPGSSILEEKFTILSDATDCPKELSVVMESPFVWKVQGKTYEIHSLHANGNIIKPNASIPGTSCVVKHCIQGVVVAGDNTGIDIRTDVGLIHVPIDAFSTLLRSIVAPKEQYSGTQKHDVDIEVYPNTLGQCAIDTANIANAGKRMFGADAPHIETPSTVSLTFAERGFIKESGEKADAPESSTEPPHTKESEPIFTKEQIAQARKWLTDNLGQLAKQ